MWPHTIENEDDSEEITSEEVHDIPAHPDTAGNGRPKRDRKQNIRYTSEEYDLSVVSSQVRVGKFTLSGIYVHPEAGNLKQK